MRRVVIVGNGPAGHRLAHGLHRSRVPIDVTVIGAEQGAAYNRVLLSSVLADGLSPEAITLPPLPDAVAVHTGVRVTLIDPSARRVRTESGTEFRYDDLVLATGAQPVLPAVPGLRTRDGVPAPGVVPIRTRDDCRRLTARDVERARAVVLGGGPLGVETARALAGRGASVRVVESADHLMPRQLDAEAGEVLAGVLRQLSVRSHVGETVSHYRPGEVALASGQTLPADVLVVAAGVRPDRRLARAAGLALDPVGGGVLVDDELRTSDPRIRAIGDCARHEAGVPGRLEPAWEQADVLAELLSGRHPDARYRGSKAHLRLRARDIDLVTLGASTLGNDDAGVVSLSDAPHGRYAKLVLRDGALAGAILLGCPDATGLVAQCYDRQSAVPADLLTLLFGEQDGPREPSPALLPDDSLVCRCNGVAKKAVVAAWRRGAATATDVSRATRAGTGCGSCTRLIDGLCSWLADGGRPTGETV